MAIWPVLTQAMVVSIDSKLIGTKHTDRSTVRRHVQCSLHSYHDHLQDQSGNLLPPDCRIEMAASLDLYLDRNLRRLWYRLHLLGHLPLWNAERPAHQRSPGQVHLGRCDHAYALHLGCSQFRSRYHFRASPSHRPVEQPDATSNKDISLRPSKHGLCWYCCVDRSYRVPQWPRDQFQFLHHRGRCWSAFHRGTWASDHSSVSLRFTTVVPQHGGKDTTLHFQIGIQQNQKQCNGHL